MRKKINKIIVNQLFESIELNFGKILEVTTMKESEFYFKPDMVSLSLKYYLKTIFNGNIKEFSRFSEVPYSTFRNWIHGDNLPQLSKLYFICNKLQIGILDFFEIKQINSFNYTNTKKGVINFSINDRKRFDHENIKMILQNEINNLECKSLTQIARMIGCDRKLLSRIHPIESKNIIENYKNNLASKKIQRQENTKIKMIETFEILTKKNIYPSRRSVEKELGGKLLIKESFIRETWDELKSSL